jgi:serine/threonine-protein kinase
VYRAYDAKRERLVAVKLFRLDIAPDKVHRLVASFEQLIAAELTHPAMAVPLATGITGVSAYLAEDYVAADSLDSAVREYGAAPPADALRVATQLAGALDFSATVDFTHGALHPRDVLLSADETRLTGVGVARALELVGVSIPVRRPYTAPERVAGQDWDRRADVFSLAALIHELLWARRISGFGREVADGLTDLAGARTTDLRDIFARALDENPDQRYPTALEFAEALKSAFPNVALTEPPPRKRPASQAKKSAEPQLPLGEPDAASAAHAPSAVAVPTAARDEKSAATKAIEPPEEKPVDATVDEVPLTIAAAAAGSAPLEAIDLRPAEPKRYDDVDTRPPVQVERHVPVASPTLMHEPPPISALERSRSAVWPLMAALAIGLAIGFAGGYGVGSRDHTDHAAGAAAVASPQSTPSTPAREGTDVAVGETQKPAVVPPPPAEAPKQRPAPVAPPKTDRRASQPRSDDRTRSARASTAAPRPSTSEKTAQSQTAASGTVGRFSGRLSVESRPEGARVFLDGQMIGTTPLAMQNVSAGEHAIRLERDGYRRWSSSVRIVASEQNRVTASLER